jgi:hypothetical protein
MMVLKEEKRQTHRRGGTRIMKRGARLILEEKMKE